MGGWSEPPPWEPPSTAGRGKWHEEGGSPCYASLSTGSRSGPDPRAQCHPPDGSPLCVGPPQHPASSPPRGPQSPPRPACLSRRALLGSDCQECLLLLSHVSLSLSPHHFSFLPLTSAPVRVTFVLGDAGMFTATRKHIQFAPCLPLGGHFGLYLCSLDGGGGCCFSCSPLK